MRDLLLEAFLWVYRVVFADGLLRYRWGQRVFFALYDGYKILFEAGPVARLQAYVPVGAFVIDVGANIGFFTVRFANWVGPAGRVIAVEPEAVNFAEMQRRLDAKGLSGRVTARRAAADREPGEVRLVVSRTNPGDHQLGESGTPVPAVTIDELVASEQRAPTLIKIDVQGAELRVLSGAQAVLERHRPVLFVELGPAALANFGTNVDEVLALLARFGYVPHTLDKAGATALTRPMLDALLAQRGYFDLLFLARAAAP
jgi:FkbM family methyltransferase